MQINNNNYSHMFSNYSLHQGIIIILVATVLVEGLSNYNRLRCLPLLIGQQLFEP